MKPEDLAKYLTEDPDILNEMDMEMGPSSPLSPEQFLNFLGAIIGSTDQNQQQLALQKITAMSPEQLSAIASQSTSVGGVSHLTRYIVAKPSRIMHLIEIAKKFFQGEELEAVVDQMVSVEEPDDEDDDYYTQGDDSDGH
jgi:hypothetical protein